VCIVYKLYKLLEEGKYEYSHRSPVRGNGS
jgi:hypothetical protein